MSDILLTIAVILFLACCLLLYFGMGLLGAICGILVIVLSLVSEFVE